MGHTPNFNQAEPMSLAGKSCRSCFETRPGYQDVIIIASTRMGKTLTVLDAAFQDSDVLGFRVRVECSDKGMKFLS